MELVSLPRFLYNFSRKVFLLLYSFKGLCYLQSQNLSSNVNRCSTKHIFAKNYHLPWVGSRANILSKYIIYIFFNFGHYFCGFFPLLFPKALASFCKKILHKFLQHCTSIFVSSKSVSHIFETATSKTWNRTLDSDPKKPGP